VPRIAEAIAWGATLERARRFGGWHGIADRALRIIPDASPGTSLGAKLRRALLSVRRAGFIAFLVGSHFLSVPVQRLKGPGRQPRLSGAS